MPNRATLGITEPTEQDVRNAGTRAVIAEKQNAEYDKAYLMALGVLGGGWTPWMKLALLDSNYHQGGSLEPVAVAYKVYRGEKRLTENSVFLRKMPDHREAVHKVRGPVRRPPHRAPPHAKAGVAGWQGGPGSPLLGNLVGPRTVHAHERAEGLAAARVTREANKAAREQERFERETPLFAEIERQEEEGRGRENSIPWTGFVGGSGSFVFSGSTTRAGVLDPWAPGAELLFAWAFLPVAFPRTAPAVPCHALEFRIGVQRGEYFRATTPSTTSRGTNWLQWPVWLRQWGLGPTNENRSVPG